MFWESLRYANGKLDPRYPATFGNAKTGLDFFVLHPSKGCPKSYCQMTLLFINNLQQFLLLLRAHWHPWHGKMIAYQTLDEVRKSRKVFGRRMESQMCEASRDAVNHDGVDVFYHSQVHFEKSTRHFAARAYSNDNRSTTISLHWGTRRDWNCWIHPPVPQSATVHPFPPLCWAWAWHQWTNPKENAWCDLNNYTWAKKPNCQLQLQNEPSISQRFCVFPWELPIPFTKKWGEGPLLETLSVSRNFYSNTRLVYSYSCSKNLENMFVHVPGCLGTHPEFVAFPRRQNIQQWQLVFFVSSIAATVKAGWNDICSTSGLQEFGFHQSLQIPRKVVQLGIQLLDICT